MDLVPLRRPPLYRLVRAVGGERRALRGYASPSPKEPLMTSTVHQAAAAAGQRAAAVEVLSAAFDADPIYRLLLPDERQRPRALGALFHVAVGDAARWGAVDLAARGAQVIGVAVWLRPGRFPPGVARRLRSLPGLVALWRAAPAAFPALARLGRSVEALHRSEPAWYLQALGVHPAAQGQGIGAALLAHGLERADRDGAAARLETAAPAAARLYERFGFATVRRGMPLVVDGPTHALLRRPPTDCSNSGGQDRGRHQR